ncbi:hypothetical protein QJS66_15975 [Kocuria rhizophila]|nr:hypothetical protein QJS66_15975 [Kocuria rhizophila]
MLSQDQRTPDPAEGGRCGRRSLLRCAGRGRGVWRASTGGSSAGASGVTHHVRERHGAGAEDSELTIYTSQGRTSEDMLEAIDNTSTPST